MPRKVTATLAATTTTVRSGSVWGRAGRTPVIQSPAELAIEASTYQRFRVSVVSAIGAHRNFQVWGMKLTAISPAI